MIHMMAALVLTEANSLMIPKDCSASGNAVRVVSTGLASFIFTVIFYLYFSVFTNLITSVTYTQIAGEMRLTCCSRRLVTWSSVSERF